MAKAIKFNILVDKTPLRDIEDLHEHFNLDDLLVHQQSGLLLRWLEVRGLADLAERVASLSTASPLEAAQELCRIFRPDSTPEYISSAVYPLEYALQHEKRLEELEKYNFARQEVIKDYHDGYAQILQSMLDNPLDYALIKAALQEIWKMYMELFRIDFNRFFEQCVNECPLALFAMIANENYRQDKIFEQCDLEELFQISSSMNDNSKQKFKKDTLRKWHHVTQYRVHIDKIVNQSGDVIVRDKDKNEYPADEAVGKILNGLYFYSYDNADTVYYTLAAPPLMPPFYTFSGKTENYWKDIESKGKKFMILKMESGNFVRNCGRSGEELNAEQVNKHFLILDGIDYKSNNPQHQLLYMEV